MSTLAPRLAPGVLLAGLLAAVLPATARAAPPPPVRVMAVLLPDGSVARIRYVGDIPPVVTLPVRTVPVAVMPTAIMPTAFAPDAIDPAFAALDRMAAAMRLQAAAMLERAAATTATVPAAAPRTVMLPAAFGDGSAGCVQGTRITRIGSAAPQVVSFRSAGCDPAPAPTVAPTAAPAAVPAVRHRLDAVPGTARPRSDPRLVEARADTAPLG
ncbi:MAG: hypothetical protein INR65_18295 [Gluconacetobacter diazotrophicus]|nr:hypothetical protein [Gluconacetobacter diazotrophicus]